MKWTRLLPPIFIILSGIVTASMKVVTALGMRGFQLATSPLYDGGTVVQDTIIHGGEEYPVYIYSTLPYLIGALLIFAGGLMLYNEIKEMRHENKE